MHESESGHISKASDRNRSCDRPVVVLITGAVGTALGRALMRDCRVVGLDRRECDAAHDTIQFDLTADSSVELALRTFRDRYDSRIDSVIHLAAYFDFTGEDNPLYREINIEDPRRLLRALQDFEVGQFVLSSTMGRSCSVTNPQR